MELNKLNDRFRNATPKEIISWSIEQAKNPILTTNFRPYEASILHAVSTIKSGINVIWVDSGYNTPETYQHALGLIKQLQLDVHTYIPKQTKAYRDAVMGIPSVEDSNHSLFTEQVKLEPFRRAMEIHKPDVWFTNLRKGQTELRNSLDVFSYSKAGVLKVSPFFYFSEKELDDYLEVHKLPNEFNYLDPTKQLSNRECGLHL